MKRSFGVLLAALTILTAGCVVRSRRAPPGPRQYVAPHAAGVQATRAEAYSRARPHPMQFGTAHLYLPGSRARTPVRYQNVGGMAIYEGDIMLGPVHQLNALYGFPKVAHTPGVMGAVSTTNESYLWPGGVIPYEIDGSVSAQKRADIEWAVGHVTSVSVLTLRPRTPADSDYAIFTAAGGGYGCSSFAGRKGGSQSIRVADCSKGSIIHEIGHAAGFYHEQSRPDREAYVTIDWEQISSGHEQWFKIREGSNMIGPYDYASIMHYSRKAFSKSGKPTIIPKDPNANIGQREGLSQLDRSALAQLYAGGGPPVGPPGTTPPPVAGFAGTYTSGRGDVSCTESGATVSCSYPGGSMLCNVQGSQLDCGWAGGGQGRAVFSRQSNGDLTGTYGDLLSSDSRGAWNLTRTGGGTTTPPPPGMPPGFPAIPGLPPVPTGLPTGLPPGIPTSIPSIPMPTPP